jgi:glycosyltransferase involved in cell wall biosynthesis
MKIGVVTHNYPPHIGGLETIVQELSRGFARRHHDVSVVTTAWKTRSSVALEERVDVHRLQAWHGTERRGVPFAVPVARGLPAAMRVLRSCDVLHAHGCLYATTWLAILVRRSGVPLFVTEHVGFVPYASTVVDGLQRLAWQGPGKAIVDRSSGLIAYNTRVRQWLEARFESSRVFFIPNGVDTCRYRPQEEPAKLAARTRLHLPPDDILGLFVGRDAPKKNLDAVLRFPRHSYTLVTCGADRRGLPASVIDLRSVAPESMRDVYAAADFLIHAAVGEGFPVAVQEAMAAGLPVALLWDRGYQDVVSADVVMAVDSLDALGQAAVTLAGDAAARRQLASSARQYAERHWSWDTTVDRYLELFSTAIGPVT